MFFFPSYLKCFIEHLYSDSDKGFQHFYDITMNLIKRKYRTLYEYLQGMCQQCVCQQVSG